VVYQKRVDSAGASDIVTPVNVTYLPQNDTFFGQTNRHVLTDPFPDSVLLLGECADRNDILLFKFVLFIFFSGTGPYRAFRLLLGYIDWIGSFFWMLFEAEAFSCDL
jgi:hypothetical protein